MNLQEILEAHKRWLRDEEGGSRAYLSGADLRSADLSGADLRSTYLSGADLRSADLSGANLRSAYLRSAYLSGADLRSADLRSANLSGAKGLLSAIDYIKEKFETTPDGIIAYKTFGSQYPPNSNWVIGPGSEIVEVVNYSRVNDCACGINVATLDWVKKNHGHEGNDIWKCLIKWEWMVGVCVPYHTDGKIRAERVLLVEIVK